jgi:hypothetical protein
MRKKLRGKNVKTTGNLLNLPGLCTVCASLPRSKAKTKPNETACRLYKNYLGLAQLVVEI